MSRKLDFIPHIPNYRYIIDQMNEDLKYRLISRTRKTSLGRPLYERINVQLIMTQECPYNCPFCIERINPMNGLFEPDKQIDSLRFVLSEHPNARLTITGGEPSLYVDHVVRISNAYKHHGNNVFVSVNTSGYNYIPEHIAHVNLSVNDFVNPNPNNFPGCTYQTILPDKDMNVNNIKNIINTNKGVKSFSFRFLWEENKCEYNVDIWNQIQNDPDIIVDTFRIGDFFVYVTFDYNGHHARITLGDMNQQRKNNYYDGYSNIIIHPDGRIGTNWR